MSAAIDALIAAQDRLTYIKRQTNDPQQIAMAEQALTLAKAQAAAARQQLDPVKAMKKTP